MKHEEVIVMMAIIYDIMPNQSECAFVYSVVSLLVLLE